MAAAVSQVAVILAKHPEPIIAATFNRMAALSLHLSVNRKTLFAMPRRRSAIPRCSGTTAASFMITRPHRARIIAGSLWMLGRPDRAAEVVAATVEQVHRIDQLFAFGYFLVFGACPIAIWTGDLAALRRYVDLLLDQAIGVPLTIWRVEGEFYASVLTFLESGEGRAFTGPGRRSSREKTYAIPGGAIEHLRPAVASS